LNRQLTPHFTLDEFRCPCCGHVIEAAAQRLATQLEKARAPFNAGMTLISAYRCTHLNGQVNGKKNSQHLFGLAADIACVTDAARFRLIASLLGAGFKRLGIGSDYIHADIGIITGPCIWTYYDA
jgi:zinc D-Ala-D-Ala carboxypeptidase